MDELLKLLRENALESTETIAKMLRTTEDDIKTRILDYEKDGIIRGYQAILDEDSLGLDDVQAVIEVKLTPEREGGFDCVAQRISSFPEVESSHLMSGAYDLLVFVNGNNLRDVASFVSAKLATIDGVISTTTHFMLKTYKQRGILMEGSNENERLAISP